MEKRGRAKAVTHSQIVFRPMPDEMLGVANLLFAAMSSLRVQGADSISVAHLNECIAVLVARYAIPQPTSTGAAPVDWAAAMRMLSYARGEMVQNLVDAHCVDLIEMCIGRLTRIQTAREEDPHTLAVN